MNKLDWYIIRQSTLMISLVLISIAGLLLITGIADEAARRVSDTYTLHHAIIYKVSTLPVELYEYIGVIVMLGTLIAIAGFNKNQELTIIQLTSNSAFTLIVKLILPSLILLPAIFYVGEWIGPKLYENAERTRAELLGKESTVLKGQWFKAQNEYINVQFVSEDKLIGINRFRKTENDALKVDQADSASYSSSNWTLNNNQSLTISTERKTAALLGISPWENSAFSPESVQNLLIATKFLSITQYYQQVKFKQDAGTANPSFEQVFWGRLLFPIEYVGLVLVALSFSFGSFRQKSVGDAAFKTIVSGVAASLIVDSLATAQMVINLSANLATATSAIFLVLIGVTLVKRQY